VRRQRAEHRQHAGAERERQQPGLRDVGCGAAAARPHARFIAGGINLLDLMKPQIEVPIHLIDISCLDLARTEPTIFGA